MFAWAIATRARGEAGRVGIDVLVGVGVDVAVRGLVAVVVGTLVDRSAEVLEGVIVGVGLGVEVEIGVSVDTGVSVGTGMSGGTLVDPAAGCSVGLHPTSRPAAAANLKNSRLDIPRG